MLGKLAVNPKTSGFLQQPDFMRMIQDINNHPDRMGNYLGDPRFQMALEVGAVCVLKRLLTSTALHCLRHPATKWRKAGLSTASTVVVMSTPDMF